MSDFKLRHHNRRHFPKKHVMVVEDDLENQVRFSAWAAARWDGQGEVQFDFMCSGAAVALVLTKLRPSLIILDHDLPVGNASDLLGWMAKNEIKDIPIITASGMPENNRHMIDLCRQYGFKEFHHFQKPQVFFGDADRVIKQILSRGTDEKQEQQRASVG